MMSKSLPPPWFLDAICTMQGTHRPYLGLSRAFGCSLENMGRWGANCSFRLPTLCSRYRPLNCREFYASFTLLNSHKLGCQLSPHILFPLLFFQPCVASLAIQLFFSTLPGPASLDKKQTSKQIQLSENTDPLIFFRHETRSPRTYDLGLLSEDVYKVCKMLSECQGGEEWIHTLGNYATVSSYKHTSTWFEMHWKHRAASHVLHVPERSFL